MFCNETPPEPTRPDRRIAPNAPNRRLAFAMKKCLVLSAVLAGALLGPLCLRPFLSERAASGQPDKPRPFGLTKRVPWTTSRVVGSPDPPHPYRVERAFPQLTFR